MYYFYVAIAHKSSSSKHDKQRNKGVHNDDSISSQRHSKSRTHSGANIEQDDEQHASSCELELEDNNLLVNGNTEESQDSDQAMNESDRCDSENTPQTVLVKKKKKTERKKKTKVYIDEPTVAPQESSSESDVSDMELNHTESPSLNQDTQSDDQDVCCSSTEEDGDSNTKMEHTDVPDSEAVFPLVPLTHEKNRSGSGMARVHRRLPQWIVEADIIEDNIQDHSRYVPCTVFT